MKKINFTDVRKKYEERINTFISLSPYVEKRKVLRYHSRMAQKITFRTTQDLIILSSLTILWNCYYDLFTENMSAEYSRKVKLKENYFITGLENKLRTIRRKYKMLGRTKIIVWTMCYQFTSYQFEETLRAFIKTIWTSQIKENVVVRDSILKIDLKINLGNWSLVVIQKFFLWKSN